MEFALTEHCYGVSGKTVISMLSETPELRCNYLCFGTFPCNC